MNPKLKRRARPLLVVSAGLAMATFGGSGCFTSGNLIARPCVEEDGGSCIVENGPVDAGTDAGADGTPDGGVLGGDQ